MSGSPSGAGRGVPAQGPVRVLHIVQSGDRGGVQRHVRDLALGLRDTTAGVAVGTTGWLTEVLQREGLPVVVLPGLERGMRPDRIAVAAHALRRANAALGATLLHAHGVLALAAATRWPPTLPVVYTAHGVQWRDSAHGVLVRTASRALHTYVARRRAVAAVIAISSQERDDAIALGFPPGIVHRVPNGTVPDPEGAAVAALDGPPAIGVATRLVAGKGLADVLQAAAGLPGTPLLVAGDGPLLAPLQRTGARLGLATRARFLGWQESLDGFYAAIAVYVTMSRKEGLPYAVLDAMARGLPVVASDIPGHRDLIRDGESGFLVRGAEQLSAATQRLLSDPALRCRIGHAAARRVRAEFSLHGMLQRHRAIHGTTRQALPA